MGQKTKLELSIVSDDEHVAGLRGEGLADFVLVLLERGLVLKVGATGGETAGFGVEVERAVNARALVREARERLDERGDERVDGCSLRKV